MVKKKYIFLTFGIGGYSGNPRYINHKCDYLKSQGWDVQVIAYHQGSEVALKNLRPFKDLIIPEFAFYPSWYNPIKRQRLLNKLASIVGLSEQMVIESTTLSMTVWGELLAKKLNAKHIVFITDEGIVVKNEPAYKFLMSKAQRKEFFSINVPCIRSIFSKFKEIENPEDYHWNAYGGAEVEKYPFPSFDELPEADYTITHFGRIKKYFPYMIDQLKAFLESHKDKAFNIYFLGNLAGQEDELREQFNLDNVHFVYQDEVPVIPVQVIEKSDIVIACAGCANLVKNNGGKAISMDVNTNLPLGLIGYTTLDDNSFSGDYPPNDKSLSQWLEDILIERHEYQKLQWSTAIYKGFDYQLRFVTPKDGVYLDVSGVEEKKLSHNKIGKAAMWLGLYNVVAKFYFNVK